MVQNWDMNSLPDKCLSEPGFVGLLDENLILTPVILKTALTTKNTKQHEKNQVVRRFMKLTFSVYICLRIRSWFFRVFRGLTAFCRINPGSDRFFFFSDWKIHPFFEAVFFNINKLTQFPAGRNSQGFILLATNRHFAHWIFARIGSHRVLRCLWVTWFRTVDNIQLPIFGKYAAFLPPAGENLILYKVTDWDRIFHSGYLILV